MSVTAGSPTVVPGGGRVVGEKREGECPLSFLGDGHPYQHYVARRKIPLAVMVGCNSVRLLLSQMSG